MKVDPGLTLKLGSSEVVINLGSCILPSKDVSDVFNLLQPMQFVKAKHRNLTLNDNL